MRRRVPATAVNKHQPWLGDEVAVAVTTPSPVALVWDLFSSDTRLALGTALPVKLRVERAAGVTGQVRLSLLTTQTMPRKKVKVNNQDREVDDVERALRFDGDKPAVATPLVAADKNELETKIIVPADLPRDCLRPGDPGRVVGRRRQDGRGLGGHARAAHDAAARRSRWSWPAQKPIEARAGVGPTGKLSGQDPSRRAVMRCRSPFGISRTAQGSYSADVGRAGRQVGFRACPSRFPMAPPRAILSDVKAGRHEPGRLEESEARSADRRGARGAEGRAGRKAAA